jgi:regulator of sirC expression with transglutaminase-like and TPR domain
LPSSVGSEYIPAGDYFRDRFKGGDVAISSISHLVLIDGQTDFVMTELSRIAHDINSAWTPDQTFKKYRALQDQLRSQAPTVLSPAERFEALKVFFFGKKNFDVLVSKPSLEKYLLPYTLLSRSGSSEMLILIFLSLAKSLDLSVTVIENRHKTILKFIDQGKSRLFVFEKKCIELSRQEIVDLVNEGSDCTKAVSAEELLTRYLVLLKTQCLRERSLIHFYKMQTYLVHYQPFALNHLIDRARAAYAIGDLVRAAEDLGQYVVFQSEKVTNNRYLQLLRRLKDKTTSWVDS